MRAKKVAIVGSTGNHFLFYDVLISLFLKEGFCVTLITNSATYEIIGTKKYSNKITYVVDNSPFYRLLKKQNKLINTHDICLIDEYLGSFSRIAGIKLTCGVKIKAIHNANYWFHPKAKSILHYIDKRLLNRFWRDRFDSFVVVSPGVKKYVEQLASHIPVFLLPFTELTPHKNEYHRPKKLLITIPGKVNSKRRDYDTVLDVIESYIAKSSEKRVHFDFLGFLDAAKEKKIYQRILSINKKKELIRFNTSFVSDEEFSKRMQDTSIILSNNQYVFNHPKRIELYGITKETGIIYQAVKHKKPVLTNLFTPGVPYLEKNILRYCDKSDLLNIILKLEKDNSTLEALISGINDNVKKYVAYFDQHLQNFADYLNRVTK